MGLPYNRKNGPHNGVLEEVPADGINCQFLVCRTYQQFFNLSFPPDWLGNLSQSLFEDKKWFDDIEPGQPTQVGDIFLFGREKTDVPKLHLGVSLGEVDSAGNALIVHANMYDGVSIWPLNRFFTYPRYSTVRAVKRLKA